MSGCRGQVAAPTSSSETGGAYGETSTSRRWPACARPSRWLRWPIPAAPLGRAGRRAGGWNLSGGTAVALNPNLRRLREAGVSVWLDTLSRELLETGEFA